jgi:hypothetical protein
MPQKADALAGNGLFRDVPILLQNVVEVAAEP